MQRRKFVIGLGSAAAGSAALVGSGAITYGEAERDVAITVATDPNGYLGMDSPHWFDHSQYSNVGENGELSLDFGESGSGGDGVNVNSKMYFDHVFRIKNQGTQDLKVWFERSEDLIGVIEFYPHHLGIYDDQHDGLIGEDDAWSFNGHTTVGDSFPVGVCIDTSEEDLGELTGTVTVHAKSIE